jgi:hypothetical protein
VRLPTSERRALKILGSGAVAVAAQRKAVYEYKLRTAGPRPMLKIRSIASAPVVMTGRNSCR